MLALQLLEALRDSGTGIDKIRAVAKRCGPKTTGLAVVEMFKADGHTGTVEKALGILKAAGVKLTAESLPSVIHPPGIEISAPPPGPNLDDTLGEIENRLGPMNTRNDGGVFTPNAPGISETAGGATSPGITPAK